MIVFDFYRVSRPILSVESGFDFRLLPITRRWWKIWYNGESMKSCWVGKPRRVLASNLKITQERPRCLGILNITTRHQFFLSFSRSIIPTLLHCFFLYLSSRTVSRLLHPQSVGRPKFSHCNQDCPTTTRETTKPPHLLSLDHNRKLLIQFLLDLLGPKIDSRWSFSRLVDSRKVFLLKFHIRLFLGFRS